MYCHGIASLALCEAYAATRDPKLYPAVLRAVAYTQNAQNRHSGGWRYHVRDEDDPGDMSQFGWQAMLLQSAVRSGIRVPAIHQALMHKFLDSVTLQPSSGLACYRPRIVPGQSPSYAMTAEALACRRLLGFPFPESNSAVIPVGESLRLVLHQFGSGAGWGCHLGKLERCDEVPTSFPAIHLWASERSLAERLPLVGIRWYGLFDRLVLPLPGSLLPTPPTFEAAAGGSDSFISLPIPEIEKQEVRPGRVKNILQTDVFSSFLAKNPPVDPKTRLL
jgi:hypothetical protein